MYQDWTGRSGRVELYHERGLGVLVIDTAVFARGYSVATV